LIEVFIPTHLPESIRILSTPSLEKAMVSAVGKKIPVLVSPEVMIAGSAAVPAEKVATPVADSVVNAPVVGVVAPTVPLMLMDAVPVRLVTTPLEGVPSAGVTSVGLVANTKAPEPVSSVTADARLDELGVARKVATFAPKPLTPVEIGKPVAFVSVTEVGVPNTGVTSVGLVAKTLLPVPVLVTLTTFLLASSAKAVEAVRPDRVVVLLALSVVNAPVLAVVAPTVPFIGPANPPAVIVPVTLPAPLK